MKIKLLLHNKLVPEASTQKSQDEQDLSRAAALGQRRSNSVSQHGAACSPHIPALPADYLNQVSSISQTLGGIVGNQAGQGAEKVSMWELRLSSALYIKHFNLTFEET